MTDHLNSVAEKAKRIVRDKMMKEYGSGPQERGRNKKQERERFKNIMMPKKLCASLWKMSMALDQSRHGNAKNAKNEHKKRLVSL